MPGKQRFLCVGKEKIYRAVCEGQRASKSVVCLDMGR